MDRMYMIVAVNTQYVSMSVAEAALRQPGGPWLHSPDNTYVSYGCLTDCTAQAVTYAQRK